MLAGTRRPPRRVPEEVKSVARAILNDLLADTILTVGQAMRRHGARRDLVRTACKFLGEAVEYRTISVRPAANACREIRVEVVCLNRIQKLSRVPYLLGLAEMRTALSIPPDRWAVQTRNPWGASRSFLPRVIATGNDGRPVAVEYDRGTYTMSQIARRHQVLATYGMKVIWGVPGLKRAASVARMIPGAEVWCISWETGSHILVQRGGQSPATPRIPAPVPGPGLTGGDDLEVVRFRG
jgi:hypothetical protein